jgi:hypothetical protein
VAIVHSCFTGGGADEIRFRLIEPEKKDSVSFSCVELV